MISASWYFILSVAHRLSIMPRDTPEVAPRLQEDESVPYEYVYSVELSAGIAELLLSGDGGRDWVCVAGF